MSCRNFQKIIFFIAILVHIYFCVSALITHSIDIFFEHVTIGQDFFQIPNAAWSFWHGGTLQGQLPLGIKPYTNCCGVNSNVYHPLFTLIVGTVLQLFSPWIALRIWATIHLLVSMAILVFLWKKFRNHQYLYLALSFYLLNSYHYYEIQHLQYHFLLGFLTILFLYESVVNGETKMAGIWYFLSLLVKPIGLLWLIPLLIYKKFKTVAIGFGLYLLASIPFIFFPIGRYFLTNLCGFAKSQASNYNFMALTHFIHLPVESFRYLIIVVAISLIFYQFFYRPRLFSIIFLWVAFQLIFYSLTFHYHYSILAGAFSLGILLNIFALERQIMVPIIFLTLPTPIILLRILLKAPAILTPKQYSAIALWSAFWLVWFCLVMVIHQRSSIESSQQKS